MNDLSAALNHSSSVSIFSSSNQMAAFLKTQNIFTVVFSPFDGSANELSAGRCFPEALLDLLCEEMFSVEFVAAK